MASPRNNDSGSTGNETQAQRPERRRGARRDRGAQTAPAPESQERRAEVSNEARYMMIQQAAYLRAELRGFEPGFELDDWLAAENEVDTLLGVSHRGSAQ